MIHLFKPTAIMIITFIVSFQGQYWTGTLYQVAFVLVQIFHYLKITVSLLLEILLIAVIYLGFLATLSITKVKLLNITFNFELFL